MGSEGRFTQIPNEVLEHLMKTHLSPNQWQVLQFIFRKTYGYHRKVDFIPNPKIIEATNLGKTVVSRVLHNLSDMQLITRNGKRIAIQEDWTKWRKLAEQSTSEKLAEQSTPDSKLAEQLTDEKLAEQSTELAEQLTGLPEQSTKVSSSEPAGEPVNKKETYTKETIQNKEEGPKPSSFSAETPASKYYFEQTGRKRWRYQVQKVAFEKAEAEVGEARMREAIDWALTSGISNIKSIMTAARRKRNGKPGQRTERADPHRRRDTAPTREEYLASLNK